MAHNPQLHNINKVKFGQRIRDNRLRQNLTMEDLAEKAGITSNYLSRIELGKGLPRFEVLVSIANALGVGIDILCGDDLVANREQQAHYNKYISQNTSNLDLEQQKLISELIKSFLK